MIRGKTHTKKRFYMLVALAGLIVLTSCSLRKPLQAFLDIPVTQNLNPYKAALSSAQQCLSHDNQILNSPDTQKEIKKEKHDAHHNASTPSITEAIALTEPRFSESSQGLKHIPLYILYKCMRHWVIA